MALKFGPAEYFSLMVLGLVGAVVLAHGSLIKAIAMVVLGLLLGLVGTDVNSGVLRFTFGIPELSDGIGFVVVAMGMFGIAEIIANLEQGERPRGRSPSKVDQPDADRARTSERMCPPILRGTALGSLLGILPGGGALLRRSPPTRWRRRSPRTRRSSARARSRASPAPEAANNAGAQTSFIPMLTLGIPANAVMALMIGAMMIQGIQPGPQVMTQQPGAVLGPDRLDVDRQPDAGGPQPAADRHLGASC